ncbi:MAG: oligosaccharide flippase family protein [Planctomycetota bacterium]|nr:oligosaccharide flippase family protein [Planctomycetota bacterium]
MGRAVAHGSFWMVVNTGITRAASLGATIILGRLLDDHAWGIYALAMSAAAIAGTFRDGGVRHLLMQRQKEYETLIGPVFWLALAFNLACGGALALAAPLIARAVAEPEATPLMLVIAASLPLSTPGVIMQARLSIDLRFREVGYIMGASGVVRFGGAIILALLGVGPLAFVLPLLACALLEWALSWRITRERLWTRPAHASRWPAMIGASAWIMLGALGVSVINWGGNLSVKPFVETEIVGAYFFAFQIVVQVGILLSSNLNAVLFPALAKIANEPARLAQASARALRQVMLLAAPMSVGLGVTFPAIEALLFAGKKSESVTAVLIQGATYAFAVLLAVPLSVQQARGRFRSWAIGLTLTGLAGLVAAAGGAAMHGTPAGIAAWAGGFTALSGVAYALVTLRRIGVPISDTLASALPGWAAAVACGALAWWVDSRLAGLGVGVVPSLVPEGLRRYVFECVRLVIVGSVFGASFTLVARVLLAGHVREALALVPARLRGHAERLLRLRSAPT